MPPRSLALVSLVGLASAAHGCGRLGFDDGSRRDALGGDAVDAPFAFACPDGYVPVHGSADLGTADFCAMRYEAKAWLDTNGDGLVTADELDADGCGATGCTVDWGSDQLPVSRADSQPWRSVSAATSTAARARLGSGFDILANRERMTIARAAEAIGANWTGGAPGDGRVYEGRTDGALGGGYAPVTDPGDPYSDTDGPAGSASDQRRTLALPGGAEIWDFAGNVQEWEDWTIGAPFDAPPACPSGDLVGYVCPGLADDDFDSTTGTYGSAQGVGYIIGGSGDAARHGGQENDAPNGFAGIYALNMNRGATQTFSGTGFRCVWRPTP